MKSSSKSTIVYVTAFAVLLFWAYFVQADTRRVDGTSMLPTLEGGDLVVIQNVPIKDIQVGNIIVYNGLCSTSGLSVVHRVIQITSSGGLITKGDNNPEPDQFDDEIATAPITQQCLEGKVVFVIPYVELLAYYVDIYGLPQWLNYLPSILILIVVFFSVLSGDEDEKEKKSTAGLNTTGKTSYSGTGVTGRTR
jgi:signal peptidase I